MKWILALALAACAAAPRAQDETENIVAGKGTMVKVGTFGYGIVPDAEPGTRYQPIGLPEEFQEDGLRVRFKGELAELEPNVRRWGTPLRLIEIEKLQE